MNVNKVLETFEPRQVKAAVVAVIAALGLLLAVVAFGVTTDHVTLAQQVFDAISHGPVGNVVNTIYYIF